MLLRPAIVAAVLLGFTASCSRTPSETTPTVKPERFTGTWQSVTSPYQHLRLTAQPLAGFENVLSMRLSFSGVRWEGAGRIEGDSLVMDVTSSSQYGAAVIAHPADAGALRVRVLSGSAEPLMLTFVREP